MARRRKSSGRKRINVSAGIKRPGALTRRAKRSGRSVNAQARKDLKSGTPLQKKQGAYYLNVLKGGRKKSSRKKRKKR